MVGAGALVTLLLGIEGEWAIRFTILAVGMLMIFYVVVGGMKGTTWVQIVKAVLLMTGTVLITVLVLAKFDFNLSDLLGAAASNTGKGDAFLEPGLKYGISTTSQIDFLSLGLALVLGTAGLPHILIRFYTVPTAKDARTSVNWAIGLIGSFYLMTLVLGFGAAALLNTGPDERCRHQRRQPGLATARRGGRRWRRLERRRDPARLHRGSGVRDDPRGGGRPDADLRVVGRPRPLRERVEEGQRQREGRGEGGPDRGVRDRRRRHRRCRSSRRS